MRKFCALIFGFALCFPAMSQAADGKKTVEGADAKPTVVTADLISRQHSQMLYPTVRVKTKRATGSGTIFYSDDRDEPNVFATFIFTNHHVVADAIRVVKKWNSLLGRNEDKEVTELVTVEVFQYEDESKSAGRLTFDAEIVAYEPDEDIAILKLHSTTRMKYVAKLMPQPELCNVRLFQSVFAVGCSLGHNPIASSGMLTSLSDIIERKSYWMMSAPIIFGNSGGAVFIERGEQFYFIGVPSRVASTRGGIVEHMAFFIPPTRIHSWLQRQHLAFLYNTTVTPSESFKERDAIRKKSRREPDSYTPSKDYDRHQSNPGDPYGG